MPPLAGTPAPAIAPAGPVLLVFFKNSCPTCQLALPAFGELARRYGERLPVVAVSQDAASKARPWLDERGFLGSLIDDADGYPLSEAFAIRSVPTVVLVDDATVVDVSEAWDRDRVNEWDTDLAARTGIESPGPLSTPGDGRPPFKPG